jgi:hypothetical protein
MLNNGKENGIIRKRLTNLTLIIIEVKDLDFRQEGPMVKFVIVPPKFLSRSGLRLSIANLTEEQGRKSVSSVKDVGLEGGLPRDVLGKIEEMLSNSPLLVDVSDEDKSRWSVRPLTITADGSVVDEGLQYFADGHTAKFTYALLELGDYNRDGLIDDEVKKLIDSTKPTTVVDYQHGQPICSAKHHK